MNKLNEIRVNIPKWLTVLDADNAVITHVMDAVRKSTKSIKTTEGGAVDKTFAGSPYFKSLDVANTDEPNGIITFEAVPQDNLYYKVLTDLTGTLMVSEADLLSYVSQVAGKIHILNKMNDAMIQMEKTGYGVVTPSYETFNLEKPQLYHSGKNYGVKLRATGSSIHLVRVDVNCEVAPIIGEQAQSEEMLKYLQSEYETNKQTVWETPIFGKSLESIVREDIEQKATSMPVLAKGKMQKTLQRIINNGKGGVICILL
ncbi:MAG: stage IV sporulation protein A [Christensenellaceae bacterium]|jgi:stage IV sporulation protein A|nr:stage IV sporulation protein A [Christensenellaceae bacterium]